MEDAEVLYVRGLDFHFMDLRANERFSDSRKTNTGFLPRHSFATHPDLTAVVPVIASFTALMLSEIKANCILRVVYEEPDPRK